jgi:hypothetical protein
MSSDSVIETKGKLETPVSITNVRRFASRVKRMTERFDVGDTVWLVSSGKQERYVTCPDCLGQCALTVILGDGSQVSISCDCCKEGWAGSRGAVRVYDWVCEVASDVIKGMEVDGQAVRYKLNNHYYPDAVFATKEEAEVEAVKVLAQHQSDEEQRFNHVKDHQTRHRTWAFSVSYHRNRVKQAKKDMEYHEGKLAVAKIKAKQPESEAA